MTKRVRIMPYIPASEGAKSLSESTGYPRLKHANSKFVPRPDDVVINWGYGGDLIRNFKCYVMNRPESVHVAGCKLATFNSLLEAGDVSIPNFTTDVKVATEWLAAGRDVIVRKVLRGSSGEGIEVFTGNSEATLPKAPLYTMYVPKRHEYRVHVGKVGDAYEVISLQRKIRDPNKQVESWYIRNHDSGFIFVRENVNPDPRVISNAKRAVEVLGLDFGAVDVIFNTNHDSAYVLEVNTAPGLEGATLDHYREFFRRATGV